MRARQQSDSFLPERPPGVHEARAALASVFLHTDPRGSPSAALTADMQPLPLPSAIKLLQQVPDAQSHAARLEEAPALAESRLASAIIVEHRQELVPQLAELLGQEVKNPRSFVKDYTATLSEEAGLRGRSPGRDDVRQSIFLKHARRLAKPPTKQASPPLQPRSREAVTPEETAGLEAAPLQGPVPESRLDLRSLVTTVDIPSTSDCDFETLARRLDPRSWGPSLFWPEVFREKLAPNGRELVRDLEATEPIGTSWEGFLFEHVEWNWNTHRVSSVRNHLRIKYDVKPGEQTIRLDYSLHACEGSQLFALVRNGGVDVDSGFQSVQKLPAPGPRGERFELRTVKNVRFSDLLDRRFPNQGPAGAGQALSYLAPAIVGLWMNALLQNLKCQT